jgi:hypothetical protein
MLQFLERMMDRFLGWMTVEPTLGFLMVVTAIVLFATAMRRTLSSDQSNSLWPWIRRIIESSISAVLFLGLLWAFRSMLTNNTRTFNSTHGSLSDVNLQSAQSIWGRPHVQRELGIGHFIYKEQLEEIPRAKPEDPPKYKTVKVRVQVPQNSIVGFNGQFDLALSEREKGYALYNGYVVNARMDYDIVNDSDQRTEVDYVFPLTPGQTLYEGFKILIDGKDMSSTLRFGGDVVQWQTHMESQQKSKVTITYTSRGMNYLYYQIPVQRQITNFTLNVNIDKLPVSLLNYPDGILAPTEIKATPDGQGSMLTWKLDRSITMAGMGVALVQPEQPGAKVFRVLNSSAFALTLLMTMAALTLLLLNQPVQFIDLALLAGTYNVQFLVMAGLSDYLGFWGGLAVAAILTLILTILVLRRLPLPLARRLVLGLVAFFAIIYPLSGLLGEVTQLNSFDLLVQVGLVMYAVVLALYRRKNVGTPQLDGGEGHKLVQGSTGLELTTQEG